AEDIRVGYVGRLESHKGLMVLLDAVEASPGLSLTIVGNGPLRPDLVARASRGHLAGRVTVLGSLAEDELQRAYQEFDVLAVPSLTTSSWKEQFGRVVVEAMASGVPVVASNSGSLSDLVGGAGLLVPEGD